MANLRIPGPIPVDDVILHEMGSQMINHRGPEFKDLLHNTTEGLKTVFKTTSDIFIITGSGTAAMEAAIANTLSPGETVINATVGVFGNRFGIIGSRYGANVINLSFPFGSAIELDSLRQCIEDNPETSAVMVTHNETSTGVTNDLESIAAVVKGEYDKLILVDGISSVCSLPLDTDKWDLDVVTSASQKGWMLPPGLSFISFSERAWEAHARSTMPRFYLDMAEYKRYLEIGQPPFTPSVSCMFALNVALARIQSEGMAHVYERHAEIGQFTRDNVKELGLSIFPKTEAIASNTCTAVCVPEGIDGKQIIAKMRDIHNVILAGGQTTLSGQIFRIGHLGQTTKSEITHTISSLKSTLQSLKYS